MVGFLWWWGMIWMVGNDSCISENPTADAQVLPAQWDVFKRHVQQWILGAPRLRTTGRSSTRWYRKTVTCLHVSAHQNRSAARLTPGNSSAVARLHFPSAMPLAFQKVLQEFPHRQKGWKLGDGAEVQVTPGGGVILWLSIDCDPPLLLPHSAAVQMLPFPHRCDTLSQMPASRFESFKLLGAIFLTF